MDNTLDNHIQAYERQSIYDFDNFLQLQWYPRRVIERAPGATSLLELGLGHGISTEIFNRHFERHVVVDASTAVIENFATLYPDCHPDIVNTYFEDFETDERFDVIVFGFILEHVDDPVQILSLFKPFLALGGKMFVTVPNAEVLNRRLGHLAGMLPDMTELSEHDHLLGHKRYYTVDTLRADIAEAGYDVVDLEGIYLKAITTEQALSLNFDEKILDAFCQVAIDYPELSCGLLAEVAPSKD
jgi:SAM-dependent methyltransferase